MTPSFRIPFALLVALGLSARGEAQTLEHAPLVRGRTALVLATGAAPLRPIVLVHGDGAARATELALADVRGQAWFQVPVPADLPASEMTLATLPPGAAPYPLRRVPVLGPPAGLGLASDTFDGTSLGTGWQVLHGTVASIDVSGGALHIQPNVGGPSVTWFADDEGVYVFKTASGDFTVQGRARAASVANPALPPPTEFRLGGILVRDPASAPGNRNSLHVALGAGSSPFPVAVEDKNTIGSTSEFFFTPVGAPECELRIRRAGDTFTLEYRELGTLPWLLARVLVRPDLPRTVQVGAMAYSYPSDPDIRVSFEELLFTR